MIGAAGLAALATTTGLSLAGNPTKASAATQRFVWPFPLTLVTSPFGNRGIIQTPNGPTLDHHSGIDFGLGEAGRTGTPVKASGAGVVVRTWPGTNTTWGNRVDIDHGDGLVTVYRHMDFRSVNQGQRVTQNQQLGGTGKTGIATGVHLHFETQVNGIAINPIDFINNYNSDVTPPKNLVGDDMFKIINTAGGDSGIWIIGMSGRRMQVQSPQDVDLLKRFQRQDDYGMLIAEMAIIEERYLRPLNGNL